MQGEPLKMKQSKFLRYTALTLVMITAWASFGSLAAYASSTPGTQITVHQDGGSNAFLGVLIQDQNGQVVVNQVMPSSPAETAGLQDGDIILSLDGTDVTSTDQLIQMVADHQPDEDVTLSIQRGDQTQDITVTLGDRNKNQVITGPAPDGMPGFNGQTPSFPGNGNQFASPEGLQLGVTYRTLTPDVATQQNLTVEDGALITQVVANSAADDAGLKEGDVITAVDGDKVDQERTLTDRLFAYEAGDVVTLTVIRDSKEMSVDATIASDSPLKNLSQANFGDEGSEGGFSGRNGDNGNNGFNGPSLSLPGLMPNGGNMANVTIAITTEPPAQVPDGHSAYECTRAQTTYYLVIPDSAPNLANMRDCKAYEPAN
jgi:membrane-associated protease RseP (regulator of RpoE activity)